MKNSLKLPRFKKWTKRYLSDRDWNYTDLCNALETAAFNRPVPESGILVYRAFYWEIDRELGSGNGPFDLDKELAKPSLRVLDSRESELTLVQESGPTLVKIIERPMWLFKPRKRHQPLNEWQLDKLLQHVTSATKSVSRGSNDICALEIHWTDDEDDVVEAFRSWLRFHRGSIRKVPKRRGRKQAWRTSFQNLAIYRLSAVGYSRKEVLEKLKIKNLSPQNFARAKRLVVEEIENRYASLCDKAKHAAKDFPKEGYGDWRRHFLKQVLLRSQQCLPNC